MKQFHAHGYLTEPRRPSDDGFAMTASIAGDIAALVSLALFIAAIAAWASILGSIFS